MPRNATPLPPIPGGQYGLSVSYLDPFCRWKMRAGRADGTIRGYRMELQYLADFLGHDPLTATESELEAWQDTLLRSRLRLKTAKVRPYFKWLAAKGIRSDDPTALLVVPKAKHGVPRPIATTHLFAAIDSAPERIKAWLLLAAYCGLRAKEVALLQVEDFVVDADAVFLHLRRTKGERERVVAVAGWVWDVIAPLLPESGACWHRLRGTGVVTPQQVSQACNEHLRKCGCASTFHSLRHWAGTQTLAASGGDLRLTQQFLGHADPKQTALYTEVRPEDLAAVADAMPRPNGPRVVELAQVAR